MAGLGIGGGGFVGVAIEVTPGTYLAPVVYAPINNESITMKEETQYRRPIRQAVDIVDAVPGNEHPEGDIELDFREDIVAYLLYAARASVTKGGVGPNFTYTYVGNANAIPAKTLSITIVRAGEIFAYTGCVLSGFKFGISDGILTFSCAIIGRQEATQSLPTPSWSTSTPYGMGKYSVEIPTASPVTDTDTFEFSVEDNGEAQFRLKSTGRGADFIRYGERNVTLTLSRDFTARTDYDNFKAVTAQTITLSATKSVNNSVSILVPVAIKDTYEMGLSGQGDLIRAQINYNGVLDTGTPPKAYQVVIKTQQDIT